MNRRRLGDAGEDAACRYLEARGWTVLDRNVVRPGGEIDIVARSGGTVAFVEVKSRSGARYGSGAEAVTPVKQRRVAQAALWYAQQNGLLDSRLRFDVIELSPAGVRWIEGAFAMPELR